MKLLMIYAYRFHFRTAAKTLEDVDDTSEDGELHNAQIAFIQVEKQDEEDLKTKETKLVKNLKWAARKNDTNTIALHSFAHLSESKADPESTRLVLNNAEKRLATSGFEVVQTPFGYFLDLDLETPGLSLARIFKDL
ncbi:hypothetical protein GWO43_25950 [candidate division KSB1 bacterium]|nr:hypothetical protein [candidate division KSB1 bacterium]NIR69256.1 hypothetical protein [candidate division KSB1 bacterium]NIS27429.1 hypothetical protein [candidate division KSB1 bacterium]NIT74255.1 hypothetical protein [candidate division KSB1 bacterium]NIU28147.1 hypothetical protein [candidate division KSB1 bacterium]